jgi:uncharacterized protein YyaL (SSP411 family)
MKISASEHEKQRKNNRGEDSPRNHLKDEKSPYLLQHANNPVDWYPWGDEAFEKAKKENKPVFLSIGYSTCHWCHVMEQESFDDPDLAKLLNDAFVSIKVDREERPDIDSIYMDVCQMFTGRGGWPLHVVMSPDKRPFFAATYIPKETRFGIIGMLELVPMLKNSWKDQRKKLMESGNQSIEILGSGEEEAAGERPDSSLLDLTYKELETYFDSLNGGFGSAPKFPSAHNLFFLLRYYRRTGKVNALHMVEKTLSAMAQGGIYDHVGFGFHRYSTDAQWILPHFEKMLYDQAMLSMAYTEAYQATGSDAYKITAKQIFTYITRDMTSPEGAFYSAEDADSEGSEGRFYLWTSKELDEALELDDILTVSDSMFAGRIFNVEESGNFFDTATGEKTGMNIPYTGKSIPEIAADMRIPGNVLWQRTEQIRQKLFLARQSRVRPQRDDKILTDWNGLMIASLAKAAETFGEKVYADTAARAVDFILKKMRNSDGRLFHRYRDGEAAIPAYLNDYAFLIWGLLELYETTFEVRYLTTALELNEDMIKHFANEDKSGFYFTADDAEQLPVRRIELHDSAVPSGNSIVMLNLIRLSRITGNTRFEDMAWLLARRFSGNAVKYPSAYTQFLCALDFALGPSYEVVIAGNKDAADTNIMLKSLRSNFIPEKIVILNDSRQSDGIRDIARFIRYQTSIEGRATAYVCSNYKCENPTTEPEKMLELLNTR